MTKKRKRTAKDAAFFTLANAIGAYLDTVGWRALVIGNAEIRGVDRGPEIRVGRFEFVVKFTGGKKA